jgi:hypothetical protein
MHPFGWDARETRFGAVGLGACARRPRHGEACALVTGATHGVPGRLSALPRSVVWQGLRNK